MPIPRAPGQIAMVMCSHPAVTMCSHPAVAMCSHPAVAMCWAMCSHTEVVMCSHPAVVMCSYPSSGHVFTSSSGNFEVTSISKMHRAVALGTSALGSFGRSYMLVCRVEHDAVADLVFWDVGSSRVQRDS